MTMVTRMKAALFILLVGTLQADPISERYAQGVEQLEQRQAQQVEALHGQYADAVKGLRERLRPYIMEQMKMIPTLLLSPDHYNYIVGWTAKK